MPRNILLIEDDADDAGFFRDAIAELSTMIRVDHVTDCNGALAFLLSSPKEDSPDLIFMDINLPAENGWECLREIKRLSAFNHIPIIMFSSLNFSTQPVTPSDVGAAAFLTKADSMEALKNSLAKLLSTFLPITPF